MLPGVGGFEYLFIAILIIIFVGPKDLPSVIRTFGKYFGKLKKFTREFKSSINEFAKESGVDDVKSSIEKAKPINLTEEITNSINETIKKTTDSDKINENDK